MQKPTPNPNGDQIKGSHRQEQPAEPRQARLTVIRGLRNGHVYYLSSGEYFFGRTEGYLINDSLASRRHMQITFKDGDFFLADLSSTNGTFLNGCLVTERIALRHGDIIRVGETILTFETLSNEPAVLGYGASLTGFADHTKREATIQTRDLKRQFIGEENKT